MPSHSSLRTTPAGQARTLRDSAVAACMAGAKALHAGNTADALRRYANGVALAPHDADVAALHGVALRSANRLQDAQRELIRAISLDPSRADSYTQLAQTFRMVGDRAQAAQAFLAAAALCPEDAIAWRDAAESLRLAGRLTDGLHVARHAATLAPNDASIANTTALLLHRAGDLEAALTLCERARSVAADDLHLTLTHAMLLRTCERYDEGWALYERRLELPEFLGRPYPPVSPRWTGDALDGRCILVQAEQGLGDQVQFVRWAGLLHQRGAGRVIVQTAPSLLRLLETAPGVDAVVSSNASSPAHDVHVDLLSLPHLLCVGCDMGAKRVPYLRPVASCDAIVMPPKRAGSLRIGLVWGGTPLHADDATRSLPLRLLENVIARSDVEIVILQQGVARRELNDIDPAHRNRFIDVAADCHDFADTAHVITQCEVVLSVDTAVAHVAGALGVATWVMVAEPAEWRWGRSRTDSIFYPSVRVFRQRRGGDWSAVITALQQAITTWTGEHAA